MQQHAIPQNVTQYQFRLVGDMTLKQFLELVAGLLLAYLFFASNLIFIFKWPLIILSVLFGVGLAFFPIEDRPLDQWIINFIRAIYGPTRFIWKKSDKIPRLFTFTPHPIEVVNTVTKTIKGPAAVTADESVSDLSADEVKRLASLDSLFSATPAASPTQASPTIHFSPTVTVRKLKPQGSVAPKTTIFARPAPPSPATTVAPPASSQSKAESVIFTSKPSVVTAPPPTESLAKASPLKSIKLPSAPRLPGLVVGAVVDSGGKLVENAIVELVDASGIPQRAMKTNPLGQFYTATPLATGTYTIHIEKAGLAFTPQQLTITTAITPPFELRATS